MKSVSTALNLKNIIKLLVLLFCIAVTNNLANSQPYSLTVSTGGTGGGTVTSAPAGIDCGATCTAMFASGTTVTITATPDATSSFAGWSGAATGTNTSATIIMDGNKSVSAIFTRNSYTLNVTKTGTGSGTVMTSPAGINCGITCSANYSAGSSITLTATPDAGSVFTGWTGGGCSGTGTCIVSMSSANSVTATFTYTSANYYADNDGDGYGAGDVIVSGTQPPNTSINNLDCDDTRPSVHPGATEICSNSTDEDCNGIVDDCSQFAFSITKGGTGGGTITSSPAGIDCGSTCSAHFSPGASVTITATPDATSSFAGWSGAATGTNTSATIIMDGNKSVSAIFTRNSYTLNVSKTGTGSGTVMTSPAGINCGIICSASYTAGSSITLTATPDAGSVFKGWTGGGCSGTGTCLVSMMSANTVSADFCLLPGVPETISGNQMVCPGTLQTYSIPTVPDVSAYAWSFPSGWTGTSTSNSINVTTGNTGVISVYAKNSCGSGPLRILDVTVNQVYDFIEIRTICDGEIYNWQGTNYSVAGTYTAAYQTINGCDSVYVLNLDVNPVYSFTEDHAICNGETFNWQGTNYSATGTYIAAYQTINGCDSIYTLNLSVNPVYLYIENHSICNGQTYIWQGNNYTSSGTYRAEFTSVHGCDSIYTLNMVVNPVFEYNLEYTMCEGQTYTWQGNEYSDAGNYTVTYTTVHGCDSTYRLSLIVNPVYVFNQNYRMSDGEVYRWQGNDYTATGTYSAAYTTINGCDSIYNLNLFVNPVYEIAQDYKMCDGETYRWQGNDYTEAGTYFAAYTTINGSDSIYMLNLVVNPVFEFDEDHAMCDGETYTWHGNNYSDAGTYIAAYSTINGCDSIYTLNLIVNTVDVSVTVIGSVITANLEDATYQWLSCDNTYEYITGETSRSITASSDGQYAVEITQGSCTDTSICVPVSTVDIAGMQKEDISVYPNPATDKIFIEIKGDREVTNFEILNPVGQVVFKGNILGTTAVETSSFDPGIYFIKLKCDNAFEIRKVVIE